MIIIMQCRSLSGNGQLRQSCTEKDAMAVDAMAIKCDTLSLQPTRQVQIKKKKSELTKRLYRGKRLETKRSAILNREIRARRNCLIISSKGALATGEFNSSDLGNQQEACTRECTREQKPPTGNSDSTLRKNF